MSKDEKFDEDVTNEPVEEEMEERSEQQKEIMDDQQKEETDAYGYPMAKEVPSLPQIFNKVLDKDDTSKAGNLLPEELGGQKCTLRDYQTLGNYYRFQNKSKVAAYFFAKGEITASTSLSKDGFLMNLSVTQKKEKTRKIKGDSKKIW